MEKNVKKYFSAFIALPLFLAMIILFASATHAQSSSSHDSALAGKGDVQRTTLTHEQLFAGNLPATPVDDTRRMQRNRRKFSKAR